ncbi:hypothetical protein K438DRAFT_630481 [Mycena galopus ATCC 62051]|nr:hypothetical protein K438DRAFT_630481 [Mycena galopus ATCC 62051]
MYPIEILYKRPLHSFCFQVCTTNTCYSFRLGLCQQNPDRRADRMFFSRAAHPYYVLAPHPTIDFPSPKRPDMHLVVRVRPGMHQVPGRRDRQEQIGLGQKLSEVRSIGFKVYFSRLPLTYAGKTMI